MEYILQQLSQLDLGQILVMGAMLWVMYGRLLSKIDKVEEKLSAQIQKLDEKVTDIDRRVCRMEGAFNNKECCMIKDSSQLKKAE